MMRPFSDLDWCAFAGAEPYEDGRDPLIGEVGAVIVIADRNGISFTWGGLAPGSQPEFVLAESLSGGDPVERRELAQSLYRALTDQDSDFRDGGDPAPVTPSRNDSSRPPGSVAADAAGGLFTRTES
jgi:hypothetical protein